MIGVHVVMSGETHLDFTAKPDGHDVAVPGNPGFNQVELRRIDKRQSEVKEMKDGAVVATVRDSLSSDGNDADRYDCQAKAMPTRSPFGREAEARRSPVTRWPASGPRT